MGTKSYIQRKEAAAGASTGKSNGKSMPAKTSYPLGPVVQLKGDGVRANGIGLPDYLKTGIEAMSGMSMDHVGVRYNSSQPAQLNALAYAQGSEIHLAPGQERHLPHEAWHVVQQAQGRVRSTIQFPPSPVTAPTGPTVPAMAPAALPVRTPMPVSTDRSLEREADTMGAKAVRSRFSHW